jgi:mono/diheme cytochrome c family protein
MLAGVVGAAGAEAPDDVLRGQELSRQMGCAQCHSDLPRNAGFRELTPDLSAAGLRYQPAWLFEFLQRPTRVRHHLGRARMPAFPLSTPEALALTAFLETQRHPAENWPALPAAVAALDTAPRADVSREQFHAGLVRGLNCLTCHDYAGQGGHRGVELTNVSFRLRPEWVRRYLVAPEMFGVPPTSMPAPFYQATTDRSAFREVTPDPAGEIQFITDHLFSLNAPRRAVLEQSLAEARRAHSAVTPAQGESLFRALNCAACHRHHSIPDRATNAAPPLAAEGGHVRDAWLEAFLRRPAPVRPSGFQPGDGARMPDFRLAPDEVRDLGAFLRSRREGAPTLTYQPAPRSAFALTKASRLLHEKLSCLACHRFGDQGGRVGPDLTSVRERLQPAYVLAMIRDPRATAPHSIMPPAPLPEDTARLIADFLLQHEQPVRETRYLSLLEHPRMLGADPRAREVNSTRAGQNYSRHCAFCHGTSGEGDGFNAVYLPRQPTRHADAVAMAARPDDTLFDGIHAGGAILNKSHLMPAWGGMFSPEEIRELVGHIRGLCRCEGPAWSRDGANSTNPGNGANLKP